MLSDHRGSSYLSALKGCRAAMAPGVLRPPRWVPYSEAGDTCACCLSPLPGSSMTTGQTFRPTSPGEAATPEVVVKAQALGTEAEAGEAEAGEAEARRRARLARADTANSARPRNRRARDTTARACGRVVCDGCSQRRQCLPQFGIVEAVRCCDKCFFVS